jgi:hypothetical protein
MLDRYYVHVQSDSEVDLTLAFFACLSFAVGLYMSRNIKSEIVSKSDYSSEQITNFEERIKQFFCITEIGIEYGCSPLHISQYSYQSSRRDIFPNSNRTSATYLEWIAVSYLNTRRLYLQRVH